MNTHIKILLAAIAIAFLTLNSRGAAVGPSGYSEDFTLRPVPADWSTRSISGGAGGAVDSITSLQVDTNIAVIAASSITNQVVSFDPTNPPAASALASWTSGGGGYLQTRPTGNRISLLLARLVNNTGSNVDTISIHYRLTLAEAATEQIRGQRVYYSFTGSPGSWANLAAPAASGPVDGIINAIWFAGTPLHILIADDNGSGTPDESCQIDDFSVTTAGGNLATTAIYFASPTNNQSIVEGASFAPITITNGTITTADFYLDGNLVGSDVTSPFSVMYSNLTLGVHTLTAVANSTIVSTPILITVVPNHPPSVALNTIPGGNVLVGSNIINTAIVTDADPGGSIQRVEFYVDDEPTPRVTDTSSPFTFELCDVLVGTRKITAVAVDQSNARGTNFNILTATNPADVTIIVPNGSTWKYFDRGADLGVGGVPWAQPGYDDAGWSNGVAEFGYGDSGNNRPETTVIGYGPNANAKYITSYFRKSFTAGNPGAFTNLIVRLLRDDAGIVYLNGTEVFRSYLTNGVVTNGTFAGLAGTGPAAADDGTFYVVTNISSALLSGTNVLAVEIHQDAVTSSDISFDLMLWGQPANSAEPVLTLTHTSATAAEISWPLTSTGYVLEFNTVINAPGEATWMPAAELDSPDATAHHVTVDISGGNRFFRLRHP